MYERIRNFREDRDKTQTEIARLLRVSQATYSDYENGKLNIPVPSLAALALLYGTSIDYLVGLTDEPAPYPRAK